MTASERNAAVSVWMKKIFDDSSNPDVKVNLSDDLENSIKDIVSSNTKGFREVTLVVLIARLLDEEFQASVGFYDCNPRSLYEGPIKAILREHHIPHGKSGPLNVAKATKALNEQWASQRRPPNTALKVVKVVKEIESRDSKGVEEIALFLYRMLLEEAKRVEEMTVDSEPSAAIQYLSRACRKLIDEATDNGNTPQKIVGFLLASYHDTLQTGIVTSGYEDRASVTNTTSKKPGDIVESQIDGTIIQIYEVTVKKFDEVRMIESYDSVKSYDSSSGASIGEIVVICRKQDAHPNCTFFDEGTVDLGFVAHQDIIYQFVDIYGWIIAQLLRMPNLSRLAFHDMLHKYICEVNTSEVVKAAWNELRKTNQEGKELQDLSLAMDHSEN
ncbi:hypothetical protein EON83_13410 [bacterium]|nr:MAG: hypothetical protein EON83_13410 [bacterium]